MEENFKEESVASLRKKLARLRHLSSDHEPGHPGNKVESMNVSLRLEAETYI